MPEDNNFQHAKYSRIDPGARVAYPTFQPGAPLGSPAWQDAMAKVGAQLANARVKGILFLNGHPYMDLFGAARLDEVGGLKRGYSRGISGLESLLAHLRPETNGIYQGNDPIHPPLVNDQQTQRTLDGFVQEVGNFTNSYVQTFEQGVCQGSRAPLVCSRYVWSSIHHHVGRVEASIHLMKFLQQWGVELSLSKGDRILLIGHGHVGQVLALLSNLLTHGESEARPKVFEILAKFWQESDSDSSCVDDLEVLYKQLTDKEFLEEIAIDVVTLGTPIRHGWDTLGISRLLHIVNHRVIRPDGKQWLARMELPQIAFELPYLTGGDYVQQLAVAGTDVLPETPICDQANIDFRDLFEPYDGFERWLECTRRATRCANDGQCLLVDYNVPAGGTPRKHLYGHGCYTHAEGMLFLATEIVEALYH